MKTRQKKVSLKDASHLYEVERRAYHLERRIEKARYLRQPLSEICAPGRSLGQGYWDQSSRFLPHARQSAAEPE
jgi:hypothetical protein